jgi:xanthine/uracil/vitamin C permease (AzgA family)
MKVIGALVFISGLSGLALAGTNQRCWVMGWTPPGASTLLIGIAIGLGTVHHGAEPLTTKLSGTL